MRLSITLQSRARNETAASENNPGNAKQIYSRPLLMPSSRGNEYSFTREVRPIFIITLDYLVRVRVQ